jgi:hypothetical protein
MKASMATTSEGKRAPMKQQTSEELEGLNFKVPADFKKAFKGYAVAQGMTMVELLREGFELARRRRGD